MELQGRVIYISEPRTGISKSTGNPWMTQDYVIETHEQFPKRMMFNVFGEEKIKQFNIQLGEELNVFFDINCREYQGKYFNDIRAWRVDRVDPNQPAGSVPAAGSIDAAAQQPPFAQQPVQAPQQPVQSYQQPAPQQGYQQPAPQGGAIQGGVQFNQTDSEEDLPF